MMEINLSMGSNQEEVVFFQDCRKAWLPNVFAIGKCRLPKGEVMLCLTITVNML
jgi:hypothetical protein